MKGEKGKGKREKGVERSDEKRREVASRGAKERSGRVEGNDVE